MKHNYFIKLLLAIIFCSVKSLSYGASPIYLAATGGSDANDGTTVGTAVATLTQAMTLVDTGGTIIVSGMIDCTASGSGFTQPTGLAISKNVTIQGTSNATDGFDGKNLTRFFSNTTYTLTLNNLKLKSGYSGNNNGGAIINTSTGTLNCENVIFDANKTAMASSAKTGAAIHFDNATGSTFKNCIFSNNEASKAGAIYINNWAASSTIQFENCAFVGNIAKETFGGSAMMIRSANNNTTLNLINCTIKGNQVLNTTATGGAVNLGAKSMQSTNVNIINCTISENTTAGAADKGAGIYVLNSVHNGTSGTNNFIGNLYIKNSIIENNSAASSSYSDIGLNSTSPTVCCTGLNGQSTPTVIVGIPGYVKVENSIIGKSGTTASRIPTGNISFSSYDQQSGSTLIGKLGTFNTTYNFYPLQSSSPALGYGLKSYLTSLTPTVTTDQIGNSRSQTTACDAGAIEQTGKPTVSISSTTNSTTQSNPIPITITFSESVTDFIAGDLIVSNGTVSNFAGSGANYTADIIPTSAGIVTVSIAANIALSTTSNGNMPSTQLQRTYSSSPSVTISSSTASTTQTNPIPVTFTFSESVTGFDISDITVVNGTKSNFVSVSGTTYTCDITPTEQGTVTINIGAEVAINGSSTGNTAATQLSRIYFRDIYVSTTGNDANDGYTPATSVAKFSTALGKAIAGEKIYVSGMVDFSTETQPTGVVISKNITIQGTSNTTDGFDGKNLTRFFDIGNYNVTLKNLKLYQGYSGSYNGGAIIVNTATGSLTCENVIFDANKTGMNAVTSNGNKTGGAIHISNIYEASFKNCMFSNNEASKTGAIHITNWASNKLIKFEGCAFVGNICKESFGGSAIFILTTIDNNTLSLINCTFAKNEVRSTANGGTIYVYKGSANTVTNIINCTVSENTTAGTAASGAGVYFKNSTPDIYSGKLYIQNSIIEGNRAASNAYSDFSTSDAPTTTTLQINNCLIGKQGSSAIIPGGCFGETNQYNYLTSASTTNAYKGGLAPYNSTSNVYPLYSGSLAIDYGASTYLTSLSPTVTTDQLGNVRTVAATNYAGAWESTPIAITTPLAPTSLVATAGDGQASIAFTTANTGGSNITNYKYSTDGTNFVACSPVKTTSPIVITGLSNDISYAIKLKAVNANGDSPESIANSVTPRATANDIVVSSATNVSALSLTPVSDVVVSGDVLTINQATNINSLTVSPGAKVTVSGTNALTATNGITLESDASGTATIIDSYATPTLSATVKQYVTAGRNWYMSAPVSTSGVGALSRGNSVVEWNEATKTWDTKSEGNLVAGKGYIQVANASQGTTGTVNFSGLTNSGEIPVTVSRTESGSSRGFNLVGNPFPSYIDWNDVIADSENAAAGLSSSFWYRTKNTLGAFVFTTYNGTSNEVVGGTTANTTINNLIPPMQAFWIKVNENVGATTHNTTLKFKNTMREHGVGDNNKFKAPKTDDRLRLRLKLENGSVSDETLIYFDAKASDDFDNYDSPKMMNNSTIVPDLYSKSGAERLVINGLSELRNNMELPIGFSLNAAASLKLQVSEITNLPSDTRIYLLDRVENKQTELVANTAYSFSITNATSNNESRFSILFRSPNLTTGIDKTEKTNVQVNVNAANQIVILVDNEANYAIYNAVGQLIENGKVTSNSQTSNYKFTKGIYVVKVNNQSTRVVVK